MPWWLLPLILGIGVVTVTYWDDIRSTAMVWADRNGYPSLKKVILQIDTIVGKVKKAVRLWACPQDRNKKILVEEKLVHPEELPEEVRRELQRKQHVVYEL